MILLNPKDIDPVEGLYNFISSLNLALLLSTLMTDSSSTMRAKWPILVKAPVTQKEFL